MKKRYKAILLSLALALLLQPVTQVFAVSNVTNNISTMATKENSSLVGEYNIANTGNELADSFVNIWEPNVINQITERIPSLLRGLHKNSKGKPVVIDMDLYNNPNDSKNGANVYTNPIQVIINMKNTNWNVNGNIKATLAHELTHTLMGEAVKQNQPRWYVEGIAETMGGGFVFYNRGLDGSNADQLVRGVGLTSSYSSYRLGYIACMYIGYLANGEGEIDLYKISEGLDKFTSDLVDDMSFENAILKHTGYTQEQFENLFSSKDRKPEIDKLIDFTNRLAIEVKKDGYYGSGSLIGDKLSTISDNLIKNKPYSRSPISIRQIKVNGKLYNLNSIEDNPRPEGWVEPPKTPEILVNYSYKPNKPYDGKPIKLPEEKDLYIYNGLFKDVTYNWLKDNVSIGSKPPVDVGNYTLQITASNSEGSTTIEKNNIIISESDIKPIENMLDITSEKVVDEEGEEYTKYHYSYNGMTPKEMEEKGLYLAVTTSEDGKNWVAWSDVTMYGLEPGTFVNYGGYIRFAVVDYPMDNLFSYKDDLANIEKTLAVSDVFSNNL